ncbi:hypothetical protein H257_09022 [Aphanomyces astaci]|uniref:Uncharacterized protein n=1 Tax=Aphanomyces astaci TaxID=112090 RepID=W4GCY7_APHAT|nr:hypothetical protein H257_09022 [Aphanomyces astaci]ETV77126.1 hypothetical protein H257_09022 [Aphanomyces astaci]|eukprot:XP_009833432.1 hypothetical protein H257_09022 [Aphanomyces astaci]
MTKCKALLGATHLKFVFPIQIKAKSDSDMTTAMPYILTGFKLLKGLSPAASRMKALGLPSLDAELLTNVQSKIDTDKQTSSQIHHHIRSCHILTTSNDTEKEKVEKVEKV